MKKALFQIDAAERQAKRQAERDATKATKPVRLNIADGIKAADSKVAAKPAKALKPSATLALVPVVIAPPAPAKKALFALADIIMVHTLENPARPGTKTWLSYELLLKCDGETVGQFLAAAGLPDSGITDPRSTLYNRTAKGDIDIIDLVTTESRVSTGIKWWHAEGAPKHVPVPRDPNALPKQAQPTVTSTGLTLAPAKRTAKVADSAKAVKAKRALEVIL